MARQLSDGFNRNGNMPPYAFGSGSSRLLKKLEGGHRAKRATAEELNRVRTWLDTGAIHAGSIAAAESGMLGSYYLNKFAARDADWKEIAGMNAVFKESCASCHKGEKRLPDRISRDRKERLNWHFAFYEKPDSPRVRLSSEAVFNLTFPENSAVLCAPLDAKRAAAPERAGTDNIQVARGPPIPNGFESRAKGEKFCRLPKSALRFPQLQAARGVSEGNEEVRNNRRRKRRKFQRH